MYAHLHRKQNMLVYLHLIVITEFLSVIETDHMMQLEYSSLCTSVVGEGFGQNESGNVQDDYFLFQPSMVFKHFLLFIK
jgi:hypothetical protein